MSNAEAIFYIVYWFAAPFAIGAGFKFFDYWISIPALFILGLYWVGVSITLGKRKAGGDK